VGYTRKGVLFEMVPRTFHVFVEGKHVIFGWTHNKLAPLLLPFLKNQDAVNSRDRYLGDRNLKIKLCQEALQIEGVWWGRSGSDHCWLMSVGK
jgi:hypothetical protein